MSKSKLFSVLVLTLAIVLVACGGSESDSGGPEDAGSSEDASAITGDPVRGEKLYKQTAIGASSAPGCITCHSLEEDVMLVGPSHAGIGSVAGSRVAGVSAEDYLRKSITNPDADVTENFTAGVMYKNYNNDLTDQEIADLVAFLLTLK